MLTQIHLVHRYFTSHHMKLFKNMLKMLLIFMHQPAGAWGPHRSEVPEKTVCIVEFVTLLFKFLRFRTCCITPGLRVRMAPKFTFQSKLELQ